MAPSVPIWLMAFSGYSLKRNGAYGGEGVIGVALFAVGFTHPANVT